MSTAIALVLAAMSSALGMQPVVGGLAGGGPLQPSAHVNCITPEQRAAVEEEIRAFEAAAGMDSPTYEPRDASTYTFYPMAANWYRDGILGNDVDLNPASGGMPDWDCSADTCDGHHGHDFGLRGWGEQDVGVPIFAALPGTVVAVRDGEPDRNTTALNVPANHVVIRHGANHYTYYWHMRRSSVAVTLGQVVRAGQQIGLVGSSGTSTGPHLHFETLLNGTVHEPFAGACRSGPSGFTNQNAIDRTFRIIDFGISPQSSWPERSATVSLPRTGLLAFNDTVHVLWVMVSALPANSTWRLRYFRPNGTMAFDSNTGNFNNSTVCRHCRYSWSYQINEMLTLQGTCRVRIDINGVTMVDAPVEARPTRDPNFNRAPAPLNSVRLEPAAPSPGDVVMCRIDTSLVHDDPDYDLLRYTYVWTINGTEVRRITSAGHADALPAFTGSARAALRCTVTPTDPRGLSAAASSVTYTFPDCSGPSISVQPTSRSACPGASATFTITVAGTPTYQWRREGIDIVGATSASHTIASVTSSATGSYDCVVTNSCGSVVSVAAMLSLDAPPVITTQPVSRSACPGGSVTFTVAASGSSPAFQWRKGGSNIAGATAASFSIPSVVASSTGTCDCVVRNGCGSVTSASASLSLHAAPAVTTQPASRSACVGTVVTLSVAAGGAPTPTFQWRRNGTNIVGATSASFTINSLAPSHAGSYDCVVSNVCGAVTISAAIIGVNAAPAVTLQPSSRSACVGGSAAFAVDATGATPLVHQWRKDGVAIPGATAASLAINPVELAHAGVYDCMIANQCGMVVSATATLTVSPGDFNRDGGVDGGDLEAFFVAWQAGDSTADVNQDGGVDGADVEPFFLAWQVGGC